MSLSKSCFISHSGLQDGMKLEKKISKHKNDHNKKVSTSRLVLLFDKDDCK